MAAFGFSYVLDKAFVAFARDLDEGAWKEVSIAKFDVVERRLALAVLLSMARVVVWKIRATWAIADLRAALGMTTADVMLGLDGDWDRAQRRFHHTVAREEDHDDPAHRAAAVRVRERLLLGNGTAQTNLSWDDEVDFGRNQVELTGEGTLAADIQVIGAAGDIAEIRKTTEALAAGLGRGPGQKRSGPRSQRVREALGACSSAFNAIHEEMTWLLDHSQPGPERDHLVALHAPFQALLDRNPPPPSARSAPAPTPPTPSEGEGEGPQ